MIADLLPLYKDGVCSQASIRAVEDHLDECPKCRALLERMNEISIDHEIARERDEVIESQSKFFRRKSAVVGSVIAAVFALPVLICLIANLATGNGLGWFFIVLTAMLIPASLIVVPLMVPENRLLLTIGSFTLSLILLLAASCIYHGGNWFFTAASSVLFGLTVCFAPLVVSRKPVSDYLGDRKGLAVMTAYTGTYVLMMLCIGLTNYEPGFFGMAFGISGPLIGIIWILFLIIRYLPANGLTKAGASVAAISVAGYFVTDVIMTLTDAFYVGDSAQMYVEPSLPVMLAGLAIGGVLAGIGLITGRTKQ